MIGVMGDSFLARFLHDIQEDDDDDPFNKSISQVNKKMKKHTNDPPIAWLERLQKIDCIARYQWPHGHSSATQSLEQSSDQSIDQSTRPPISRIVSQSDDHLIDQSDGHSLIQLAKQSISQSITWSDDDWHEVNVWLNTFLESFEQLSNQPIVHPINQSIIQSLNRSLRPLIKQSDDYGWEAFFYLFHCVEHVLINQMTLITQLNEIDRSPNQSINPTDNKEIKEIERSTNQSINNSIDQSVNVLRQQIDTVIRLFNTGSPVKLNIQSLNQPNNQSLNQPVNQSINLCQSVLISHRRSCVKMLDYEDTIGRLIEINHSINISIDHPTNSSFDQCIPDSLEHSVDDESIDQPINQSIDQPVDCQINFGDMLNVRSDFRRYYESADLTTGCSTTNNQSHHPLGDQSVNQSINHSDNQVSNSENQQSQSGSMSISQSINQSIDRLSALKFPDDESIKQSIEQLSQFHFPCRSLSQSHEEVFAKQPPLALSDEFIELSRARFSNQSIIHSINHLLNERANFIIQSINQSINHSIIEHCVDHGDEFFVALADCMRSVNLNESINQSNKQSENPSINNISDQSINHPSTGSAVQSADQSIRSLRKRKRDSIDPPLDHTNSNILNHSSNKSARSPRRLQPASPSGRSINQSIDQSDNQADSSSNTSCVIPRVDRPNSLLIDGSADQSNRQCVHRFVYELMSIAKQLPVQGSINHIVNQSINIRSTFFSMLAESLVVDAIAESFYYQSLDPSINQRFSQSPELSENHSIARSVSPAKHVTKQSNDLLDDVALLDLTILYDLLALHPDFLRVFKQPISRLVIKPDNQSVNLSSSSTSTDDSSIQDISTSTDQPTSQPINLFHLICQRLTFPLNDSHHSINQSIIQSIVDYDTEDGPFNQSPDRANRSFIQSIKQIRGQLVDQLYAFEIEGWVNALQRRTTSQSTSSINQSNHQTKLSVKRSSNQARRFDQSIKAILAVLSFLFRRHSAQRIRLSINQSDVVPTLINMLKLDQSLSQLAVDQSVTVFNNHPMEQSVNRSIIVSVIQLIRSLLSGSHREFHCYAQFIQAGLFRQFVAMICACQARSNMIYSAIYSLFLAVRESECRACIKHLLECLIQQSEQSLEQSTLLESLELVEKLNELNEEDAMNEAAGLTDEDGLDSGNGRYVEFANVDFFSNVFSDFDDDDDEQINQSINQSINLAISQSVNEAMDPPPSIKRRTPSDIAFPSNFDDDEIEDPDDESFNQLDDQSSDQSNNQTITDAVFHVPLRLSKSMKDFSQTMNESINDSINLYPVLEHKPKPNIAFNLKTLSTTKVSE